MHWNVYGNIVNNNWKLEMGNALNVNQMVIIKYIAVCKLEANEYLKTYDRL